MLKALRRECPSINFIYIADSGNAPYGSRPPEFIEKRIIEIADYLVGAGAQIIVVACNTATTVAIEKLRARIAIPVVAVEPAIKPAVARTKTGVVGVLATERTIESAGIAKLCREFGQGVALLLQPCPGLVERVERGELATDSTREHLCKLIQPLLAQGADTLVLGCTHYVFLEPEIRRITGPEINIIESSEAVARQTMRRLGDCEAVDLDLKPGDETFLTTSLPEVAQPIFSLLWGGSVEVRKLENRSACASNLACIRA